MVSLNYSWSVGAELEGGFGVKAGLDDPRYRKIGFSGTWDSTAAAEGRNLVGVQIHLRDHTSPDFEQRAVFDVHPRVRPMPIHICHPV